MEAHAVVLVTENTGSFTTSAESLISSVSIRRTKMRLAHARVCVCVWGGGAVCVCVGGGGSTSGSVTDSCHLTPTGRFLIV